MKKRISLLLLCAMLFGCLPGCAVNRPGKAPTETVKLTVSGWPKESDKEQWEYWNKLRDHFMALNPDIEIIPGEMSFDAKTYMLLAATGQISTLYSTYYTEVDRIIAAGFTKDVTEIAKERGWYDAYNDRTREITFRNDRMHVIPVSCYSVALQINKNVFEAAGLVNEDGTCMIPETYEEVVEFSKIIREKTGAYGFMIGNSGWYFVNIAWSFGTSFMKQVDGKWQAAFDSPQCAAALQWLKDLKYEHGLLPYSEGSTTSDTDALFANNQLGMMFGVPTEQKFLYSTDFSKDDVIYAAVPEGPGGRVAQMGGLIYAIDRNATDEQVEAAFRWLEFLGLGPTLSEAAKISINEKYDTVLAKNGLVGLTGPTVWKEDTQALQYIKYINQEKRNVDSRNYMHYETVPFDAHPEDPVNFQALYTVLGECIKKTLISPNSDPAEILEEAAIKFQKEYLNEINYQS